MDRETHHQSELLFVTYDDCEPWDQNPRTNASGIDQDMQELIASVSANGVRQSLSVRAHPDIPGRFQIAAGAHRWYALGHAIGAGARPRTIHCPSASWRSTISTCWPVRSRKICSASL